MHRTLVSLCLLVSLGLAAPAGAAPRPTPLNASAPAAVSPTTLPPSAPGRLAYSTATYEATDTQASMGVHGLGTIGLDGSDQRTLTDPQPENGSTDAGFDHTPMWSPDGTWLAYLQNRPGSDSVAVIPRDGGDPQIIDPHGMGPAWSPDGRHLAWISIDVNGDRSIGIADVVTTASSITVTDSRTLEVPEPGQPLASPVFSPDGQSLAFANGDYFVHNTVLYAISISGENLRQMSHDVGIDFTSNAYAYSPDGTSLMFRAAGADRPSSPQTYLVDPDGSNQRVVSPGGTTYAGAWSPAGDWIALETTAPSVMRVDLEGHVLGYLASGEFSSLEGLVFSPDGTRIYTVASPSDQAQWAPDLYAIPVNGDATQRLTFDHSVFQSTVQAIDPGAVLREFGDGAAETAVAAVTANFDAADTLVVSPADDYAASLAAAPLAAHLGAPALVTGRGSLDSRVLETARGLGVANVVLVGSLSPDVAASIRGAGLNVTVVGGSTSPYSVGAAVARQLAPTQAFLVPLTADTQGWRLPLATAGLAAFERQPLLYTSVGSLPRPTKKAIRTLGITSVTFVGDNSVVSPRVRSQLTGLGVKVHRVRSSDPYAISAQLAGRAVNAGAKVDQPVVASGAGWDASVTSPALAAVIGQANLLVDGRAQTVNASAAGWLAQHDSAVQTITLVGGVGAVRPAVEVGLEQRLLH